MSPDRPDASPRAGQDPNRPATSRDGLAAVAIVLITLVLIALVVIRLI